MKNSYIYSFYIGILLTLTLTITTWASTTYETEPSSFQAEILNLFNEKREEHGLSALSMEPQLNMVSDIRVRESSQLFSHTRPDGRRYSTAFSDMNISYRYSGEILAHGYKTPKHVVAGWLESSGHHDLILSENYTHVGISHIAADNHLDYWAVIFISR